MKRAAGALLCLVLQASMPGAAGWVFFGAALARAAEPQAGAVPAGNPPAKAPAAQPAAPAPGEVMKFLEAKGIFNGSEDPLRGYMMADGKVTPMGAAAFAYFTKRPEEVDSFKPTFDRVRQSGPFNEKKAQAIQQALQDYQSNYGDIGKAGAEDAFSLGGRLNSILTGAAEVQPEQKSEGGPGSAGYTQVEVPDGYEFYDKDGLLQKTNKPHLTPAGEQLYREVREKIGSPLKAGEAINPSEALGIFLQLGIISGANDPKVKDYVTEAGEQLYNRQIKQMQQTMNQNRFPDAPKVPETGRYNQEMYEWTYARLHLQVSELELQLKADRMARLAELLGKQFRDDQWFKDPKMMARLEAEARAKTFKKEGQYDAICGRPVHNYLELVDCKLAKRQELMKQTEEKLAQFKGHVDDLKDVNVITQEMTAAFQRGEQLVSKYITLTYLEAQRWQADAQLERLDPRSPDHELILKGIAEAGMDQRTRADYEKRGQDIAARVQRLKEIYKRLEKQLDEGDYATAVSQIQGALAGTQKELADVGMDWTLYATMPSMTKAAKDDSSGWINNSWKAASEGMNWTSKKLWGGNLQGRYLENRSKLSAFTGAFDNVQRLIAAGKWKEARAALIAADPTALQRYGKDMSLQSADLGDFAKAQAVLREASDAVQNVSTQHFWVRVVGEFILWSVGTAIIAPAAGALLGGLGRGSLAAAAAWRDGNIAARTAAFAFKVAGEVLENSAIRLQLLSPAASKIASEYRLLGGLRVSGAGVRILDATIKRSLVTGSRIGSFAAMSGGISGGFTAVSHLTQGMKAAIEDVREDGLKAIYDGSAAKDVWKGGESAFSNPVDAGLTGAKFGTSWALESWHPLLGMGFGLPSSAVEGQRPLGIPLGDISENLASRGTLGLGAKLVESGTGAAAKLVGQPGLTIRAASGLDGWMSAAVKAGGARATAATMFGLADNISKYMLFSQGIGWAAHEYSWRTNNIDGDNLERRIKRAAHAEQGAMQAPYWLLLPVFPARYEVQGAMQARQLQGYRELQKAKELDLVANSAEGQQMLLRGKQETPVINKIFQWNPWADEGNFGSYTVTKDMKYDAIREILPGEITGRSEIDPKTGKPVVDPLSVNPLEYLKVSQMEGEPGKITKIGRLHLGDEVRDQSARLFEEVIRKKPALAAQILDPKNLGRNVEGFGYVRPEQAEEVARVLYRVAKDEGLIAGVKPRAPGTGETSAVNQQAPLTAEEHKALVDILPRVRERLEPYAVSEGKVTAKAGDLLQALAKNKTSSPELKAYVDEMMQRTDEWAVRTDQKGTVDTGKPWNKLVQEFRNDARWKANLEKLSPGEREVITSTLDYLEAIHGRFSAFNRVDVTYGRMQELLSSRKTEAQGTQNKPLAKGLDKILTELSAWRQGEAETAPVQGEGARMVADPVDAAKQTTSYNALIKRLNQGVDVDATLAASDRAQLKGLLKEMDNAPWLLHDSKGGALPGWRPGQFQALMTFLTGLQTGGADAAKTIRVFQMLGTGMGKTLLAYEGLLPIADADAAASGKKVVFLTVLSNLEAQARMEFRAMRKITSDMQIDTWENFKTKIAQGKLRGRGGADDYWIIGDEMDGAALQPALTIGETTAMVPNEDPSYRHLKGGLDKMERLLSSDARDLSQQLRFESNRQKTLLGRMAEKDPYLAEQLRPGAEKLSRLGERLEKARGADLGEIRSQLEKIVGDQQATLEASASFGIGDTAFVESQGKLTSLASDIGKAKNAKGLSTQIGEADARLVEQIKALSAEDASGSAQARTLRPLIEGLRKQLGELGGGAEPVAKRAASVSELLSRFNAEEQSVIRAGAKPDGTRIGEFRDSAGKVLDAARDAGSGRTAADPKAIAQQLNGILDEQGNVLWQARWKSGTDVARAKAQELVNQARSTRAKADALRASKPDEAARLDLSAQTMDGQIRALESEKGGRLWLEQNGEQILQTAKEGKTGWQARIRDLMEVRRGVMDSALDTENPIYTIFKEMKENMYPLYSSKVRTQNDGEVLTSSPRRLTEGALRQRQELVDRLENLAKRYEGRSDPASQEAHRMALDLLGKARTELSQWQGGEGIAKALETKEPGALKAAREAFTNSSSEVGRMDAKVADAAGRIDSLTQELKTLRQRAAKALPDQATELSTQVQQAEAKLKTAQLELDAFKNESHAKNDVARIQLQDYLSAYQKFLKESLPDVVKSYEQGAAENAAAWVKDLKAKGFDADGLRAQYRDLNARADQAADPAEASRLRSEAGRVQNDLAALEGVQSQLSSRPQMWKTEQVRLNMTSKTAVDAMFRKIDGVSATELAGRYALKYTGAQWLMSKIPGVRDLSVAKPVTESTQGLTRVYANKLIKAVMTEPSMSPVQRWNLFWSIAPSAIWPRGIHYAAANTPVVNLPVLAADYALGKWKQPLQPKGSTWVRTELFNLARGYGDDPATVRFDNGTKKVNAVHNGQWFETMDTPTRRFWELAYGSDLTLPYEHKTIVTMNDFVRDNHDVRFVGMSGTAGPEFRRYLQDNAVRLSGDKLASTAATDMKLDVYASPSGKYQAILDALKATKDPGGLVVLSLPDTRTLKLVRNMLLREGLKENQIAQVFSDTELLRVNKPEANVGKQMNLYGLNDGGVKVLMLDTRVGGRGLDLNFKGQRGSPDPHAFKGYNKMEMLIVDPQNMTEVHNIQAQGRISLGRVNPGTERNFRLVLDASTAQKDPMFMEMVREEPRFWQLSQNPDVRAIASSHGRLQPQWVDVHEYISSLEGKGQASDVTMAYRDLIREYLVKKQGEVELDQLRSASVKQDQPHYNPLMRGLEGWAR